MEYTCKKTELYHHGIKGQQWGVRRYQNEDGTLTAEGRKRYGVEDGSPTLIDAKRKDNKNAKKAALIAGGVAATALAGVGIAQLIRHNIGAEGAIKAGANVQKCMKSAVKEIPWDPSKEKWKTVKYNGQAVKFKENPNGTVKSVFEREWQKQYAEKWKTVKVPNANGKGTHKVTFKSDPKYGKTIYDLLWEKQNLKTEKMSNEELKRWWDSGYIKDLMGY